MPDVDVVVELDRRQPTARRASWSRAALARRQAGRHRQQGAAWPITAPRWRGMPRRRAWRWPSRRRSPAASRSSRRCARGWPPTDVTRISGILNGTCNYILTTMRETGREFADVLAEAQQLRLCRGRSRASTSTASTPRTSWRILAAVAFGSAVDFAGVHVEGIRHVSALDIEFADELGYRIKLLGIARLDRMRHRAARPSLHGAAHRRRSRRVDGVFNAVVVEGDFVGRVMLEGRGAGAGPTASAVVADLIDIARGRCRRRASRCRPRRCRRGPSSPMARHLGAYYLRLMVVDRPGVIADVAAALRDEQVSMEQMIQRGRAPGEAVPVVLTTHETEEAAMRRALDRIARARCSARAATHDPVVENLIERPTGGRMSESANDGPQPGAGSRARDRGGGALGLAPDGPRRREGGGSGRGRRHAPGLERARHRRHRGDRRGRARRGADALHRREGRHRPGPAHRHRARSARGHDDHRARAAPTRSPSSPWRRPAASSTRPTSTWTRSPSAADLGDVVDLDETPADEPEESRQGEAGRGVAISSSASSTGRAMPSSSPRCARPARASC